MKRIAYFPHERPGDALVDVGQLPALRRIYGPCEVVAFCTEANRELFGCLAWCDAVETYEAGRAWAAEEIAAFGTFEAVFNTRHDRDAFERTRTLDAKARYGYETGEVPEELCRKGYAAYLPLSTWDDETLRWHTSVSEQGASLVRLVEPAFHIDFPRLGEGDFRVDEPEEWTGAWRKSGKTVLFVPGAGAAGKRWPMERFLELARLVRREGFETVFQVGPCERALGQVATAAGFEVCDTPRWGRMAAQMRRVFAVVGNDTGPMHLAAMLGVPTVTLYFHGSERTWFTYGGDERAEHVALHPACSKPRCLSSCPEAGKCGGKIEFGAVTAAWRALRDNSKTTGHLFQQNKTSPTTEKTPSRQAKKKIIPNVKHWMECPTGIKEIHERGKKWTEKTKEQLLER